jgi:mevalonate kinase
VNARQVADFFAGSTRGQWLEINQIAHRFAAALRAGDYAQAAALVQREHDLRVGLVPSRITPVGRRLQSLAQARGCGFAVSGAGNGGCVWALGANPQAIATVREEWAGELAPVETARVLEVEVDGEGVRIGSDVIRDP